MLISIYSYLFFIGIGIAYAVLSLSAYNERLAERVIMSDKHLAGFYTYFAALTYFMLFLVIYREIKKISKERKKDPAKIDV